MWTWLNDRACPGYRRGVHPTDKVRRELTTGHRLDEESYARSPRGIIRKVAGRTVREIRPRDPLYPAE
jgi:hypothetical protein